MSKKPLLVLIDGNAVFHRAYHAIAHLTNAEGQPTGGIYGFAAMLIKAYADLQPDYAVIAWDKAKTSTSKRLKLYPEYKAKRLHMPEDFYAQIPYVRELAEGFGLPFVELDGYEADDIIGTLARRHPELKVVIVTNDRDSFQLLDGHVQVYMQRKGMTDTEIMDGQRIEEKYGFRSDQVVDFKSLAGDASDNIPGVPGVGEKTATDLLQKYGTLDGIYQHLDEIPGKLKDRLVEGKHSAYLSQKIATIDCDAPVKLKLEEAKTGNYDRQKLHDLFRQLGFKSLMDKVPAPAGAESGAPSLFDQPPKPPQRDHLKKAAYQSVTTTTELEALAKQLQKEAIIAVDTETDGVDSASGQLNLVGLSISFKEGNGYYIPVGHQEGEQLPLDLVISKLGPILEDPKIGKVGHNLKYDVEVFNRYGVKLGPVVFDTMIGAFLINPLGRTQSLSDLAYSEFGIDMIPITELIGTGKSQLTFDHVPIPEAATYAVEDADLTWRLYQTQLKTLASKLKEAVSFNSQKWTLARLMSEIEAPLIPVLAEMELAGIELDKGFLEKLGGSMSRQITSLEEKIYKLAGEPFNLNSPGQLSEILFGKLGLSTGGIKRGKTGLSTAATELEKLRGEHKIIDLLMEYRELAKLKSTYVDVLPTQVATDKRVHTSFSQTIAQTGRLSSNNPNLQNIPVRTEVGREIRQAFVAPAGRVLVSADYSQIELRVAAALSGDTAMIETFKEGVDLHQRTAAEIFGVELDKVTKDQRSAAKTINFGVLYGMSPHGLSVATGASREEAVEFIKRYFEVRPQLASYLESVKEFARKHEYTETIFARRRPCGEINSSNYQISQAAERMAVNVPLQGTAADIFKLAMIALAKRLDGDSKLLLQIHDELIVETTKERAEAVAKLMQETMEGVYELGVPLAVDTAIGRHWGEL